jgi:hypothetical protein
MNNTAPLPLNPAPNLALNLAPFGRWTLRDRAAQRRLALRLTVTFGAQVESALCLKEYAASNVHFAVAGWV